MNITFRLVPLMLFLALVGIASGQTKTQLIWDDPQDLISSSGETLLFEMLLKEDIEVVTMMDYKKRCEYVYAELNGNVNKVSLELLDCNRKVLGKKLWQSKFFSSTEEERAEIIANAILGILDYPVPTKEKKLSGGEGRYDRDMDPGINHFRTRHFFFPSALSQRKGEFHYHTLTFVTHDVQYGITNSFSLGMGTTPALIPFYLTGKYSFPINKKNTFSIGDIFYTGTWMTDFYGNIGYGLFTHGTQFDNFSFGVAHLYYDGGSEGDKLSRLMLNLSGMARFTDYIHLVSENFYLRSKERAVAYFGSDPLNPWNWDYLERINVNNYWFAGILGFRFINKHSINTAWQLGLLYVVRGRENLDPAYKADNCRVEYNLGSWRKVIVPIISFTTKL